MALLLAKKVIVSAEYSDFADVFLQKSANVFLEQTIINKHAIELEKGKQLIYKPIYSLELVECKTFKPYIEINLANNFIRTSKLPANTSILFLHKPNNCICLCVNYLGLNNLTIKNWYPLLLISKFLYWLGQAKQFSQLNLISAYYWMKIKEGDE